MARAWQQRSCWIAFLLTRSELRPMTERSWFTTLEQAVGTGLVVLAIDAWLDGHAGTIHAVMAVLGLAVTFGDLLIAPSQWREGFMPSSWGEATVFGAIVGAVMLIGRIAGL
jgi:hypothetical protein